MAKELKQGCPISEFVLKLITNEIIKMVIIEIKRSVIYSSLVCLTYSISVI